MTPQHARELHEAKTGVENAYRNLDNAVNMPRPEDDKLNAAGQAVVDAENLLEALLHRQPLAEAPAAEVGSAGQVGTATVAPGAEDPQPPADGSQQGVPAPADRPAE